jgi:hypothetical protein
MADQEQKLCDNCHERPATNNICYGGSAKEGRSLCHVCLLQDLEVGGLTQRFNETVRTGLCKYCGAPAETSWGGSSSHLGDHYNLVCMTCFNDLTEFIRRPENVLPTFTPGDEAATRKAMADLEDLQQRQDEFVKQQVLKRKSKQ